MKVILVYEVYEHMTDIIRNQYKTVIGVAKDYPAATSIIVERLEWRKENLPPDNWTTVSAYEYVNEFGLKLKYEVEEHKVREY